MGVRITDTSDLWWKSAIIYCLDIETYADSNGDGIGDLAGLAARIDYLAELGVNCLWLMPFYPSPDRDDGYDILDFYGVDQRLECTEIDLDEVVGTDPEVLVDRVDQLLRVVTLVGLVDPALARGSGDVDEQVARERQHRHL